MVNNYSCPKCKAELRATKTKLNGFHSAQFNLRNSNNSGLSLAHWKCSRCTYSLKEYKTYSVS